MPPRKRPRLNRSRPVTISSGVLLSNADAVVEQLDTLVRDELGFEAAVMLHVRALDRLLRRADDESDGETLESEPRSSSDESDASHESVVVDVGQPVHRLRRLRSAVSSSDDD